MRIRLLIGVLLLASPSFAQTGQPARAGGAGQPQTISVVDLVERELISSGAPRRETLVACSGTTRTTVLQLNQDQPERLYDGAEINYYVVAGEGAVRMSAGETPLAPGSLIALPRGTAHALMRRGKRPLILLTTLSGSPCEEVR